MKLQKMSNHLDEEFKPTPKSAFICTLLLLTMDYSLSLLFRVRNWWMTILMKTWQTDAALRGINAIHVSNSQTKSSYSLQDVYKLSFI